ncbi:MAG: enoyl-CoA hydratase/isomerase family protein [Gammaproteobacteria bacterium]|nr:enoyl-CoA hydratase/isomerase family protein [Gammaproteobacteria bacterium]
MLIDADGDKAFCAGGDVQKLYETGRAGDYAFGRRFWADEYRLNAKIAEYPKPYVALMQGFVMGGGVGIAATARTGSSATARGSPCRNAASASCRMWAARCCWRERPARLGEYLGTTGARLGARTTRSIADLRSSYMPQCDVARPDRPA